LEKAVNDFAKNVDNIWNKNAKLTNIMKYSKSWWDNNWSKDLEKYRFLKSLEDWKLLRSMLPGDSMDMGKGYDDMIGCAIVVLVSVSCSRYHNLT